MSSSKTTYVLAVKTDENPQNYYPAGSLAEIRAAYKDILQPAKGDRSETRRLQNSMQLYKLTAEPAWRTLGESPSLQGTLKSLRSDGLKAVGVDADKISATVKNLTDTVKSKAPELGQDLRKAATGGMLDKLKLAASASSLFSAAAGSLNTLKDEGKAAIATVQGRLTGFEGNAIITPDGAKLVHATFIANPENAKTADLSVLKETRKAASRSVSPK